MRAATTARSSTSRSSSATSTGRTGGCRSEEHTSELQSQANLVCRLLLGKKRQHLRQALSLRGSDVAFELGRDHRTDAGAAKGEEPGADPGGHLDLIARFQLLPARKPGRH